jgi:hypothetical protein
MALMLSAAGPALASTRPGAFASSNVVLAIGPPAAGSVAQSFEISGWAIDLGATSDCGIDAIHIWA